jgi:glyoxylase-like metal-dependent hydrolase (beta-lactamase superfamily II)
MPFSIPLVPGRSLERFTYVYLLYGEGVSLIDTGVAGSETRIFRYLEETGRDPREISEIVLTHSHPDHIGACRAIRNATGCIVAAHPQEREWIENVEVQKAERPVPGFDTLVGGSVQVNQDLSDGDHILVAGNRTLSVFHTPGHSPGSISLFAPDEGVLFSGDALPVPGEIPLFSDFSFACSSVRKLQQIEGIETLCSSWETPISRGNVRGRIRESREYLSLLRRMVRSVGEEHPEAGNEEFCREFLTILRIPEQGVPPFFCRSVQSIRRTLPGRRPLKG